LPIKLVENKFGKVKNSILKNGKIALVKIIENTKGLEK
jgi:hypothetical protein